MHRSLTSHNRSTRDDLCAFMLHNLHIAEIIITVNLYSAFFVKEPQTRRLSLKSADMRLYFAADGVGLSFIPVYKAGSGRHDVLWKWQVEGASRAFKVIYKVIEAGTNRKSVRDFLLLVNSKLSPIAHRFGDIATQISEICVFRSTNHTVSCIMWFFYGGGFLQHVFEPVRVRISSPYCLFA